MLNHQRVTFPLGCLFLPWSQELQFVEDVVLVYGGWADPGAVPHGDAGAVPGIHGITGVLQATPSEDPRNGPVWARASNGPGQ